MSPSPLISLEKTLLKVIWAQAQRSSLVWGWQRRGEGIVWATDMNELLE